MYRSMPLTFPASPSYFRRKVKAVLLRLPNMWDRQWVRRAIGGQWYMGGITGWLWARLPDNGAVEIVPVVSRPTLVHTVLVEKWPEVN